ncbi:MAG: TatD family hydrolase [Candidatus Nealsonbacteria bacterium]|nr:TatD family hydrolase [Candidatus Nealsonbacteria bacterium]
MNPIIDTHAHLNFKDFEPDIDQVISRCLENNISVINVGSEYITSKRSVEMAELYNEGLYVSVGLHPSHVTNDLVKPKEDHRVEVFDYNKYKELALSNKVVAIGETGLDYYYKPKDKDKINEFKAKQKEALIGQMDLADELGLPNIFHCRMAHNDMFEILESYRGNIRGVIHCFTGNLKEAQKYIELGLYLGFAGIMFKFDLREVIEKIPLDRVLVETDCPYLTPPLFKGRNEPLYIKEIIKEIAQIRSDSVDNIERVTTENAKKLFNI